MNIAASNTNKLKCINARLLPGEKAVWVHIIKQFYAPSGPIISKKIRNLLTVALYVICAAMLARILIVTPREDLLGTVKIIVPGIIAFFGVLFLLNRAKVGERLAPLTGPEEYRNVIITDARIILLKEDVADTVIQAHEIKGASEDYKEGQKAIRLDMKDGPSKIIVAAADFKPAMAAINTLSPGLKI